MLRMYLEHGQCGRKRVGVVLEQVVLAGGGRSSAGARSHRGHACPGRGDAPTNKFAGALTTPAVRRRKAQGRNGRLLGAAPASVPCHENLGQVGKAACNLFATSANLIDLQWAPLNRRHSNARAPASASPGAIHSWRSGVRFWRPKTCASAVY